MISFFAKRSVKQAYQRPILIIFSGESNSGGMAVNTDTTVKERNTRESVQILNNDTLSFEKLHIGVNNNIGHFGLDPAIYHGWELQLAFRAADKPSQLHAPIFLCKTGQGGSNISQWNTGGLYYTLFLTRVNKAIDSLSDPLVFLFYTQGINDAILGADVSSWKAATIAHFTKIRTDLGFELPIIIPKFMPGYSAYDSAFEEIATMMSGVYVTSSTGAALQNTNHWSYSGMKTTANRLIDKMLTLL